MKLHQAVPVTYVPFSSYDFILLRERVFFAPTRKQRCPFRQKPPSRVGNSVEVGWFYLGDSTPECFERNCNDFEKSCARSFVLQIKERGRERGEGIGFRNRGGSNMRLFFGEVDEGWGWNATVIERLKPSRRLTDYRT